MTRQTRSYIDLSDIVALRCECEECHATISLPITDNIKTHGIRACPSCNEPWAVLPEGSSMELAIQKLGASLREVDVMVEQVKAVTKRKGFSISLELKPDPVKTDASGHASGEKD